MELKYFLRKDSNEDSELLIELYGIEITIRRAKHLAMMTFNRTIWN